jgi:hypothetical protein
VKLIVGIETKEKSIYSEASRQKARHTSNIVNILIDNDIHSLLRILMLRYVCHAEGFRHFVCSMRLMLELKRRYQEGLLGERKRWGRVIEVESNSPRITEEIADCEFEPRLLLSEK